MRGVSRTSGRLHADPDIKSVYEAFPQKLLEEILKLCYRPAGIEFRSGLLIGLSKIPTETGRVHPGSG